MSLEAEFRILNNTTQHFAFNPISDLTLTGGRLDRYQTTLAPGEYSIAFHILATGTGPIDAVLRWNSVYHTGGFNLTLNVRPASQSSASATVTGTLINIATTQTVTANKLTATFNVTNRTRYAPQIFTVDENGEVKEGQREERDSEEGWAAKVKVVEAEQ